MNLQELGQRIRGQREKCGLKQNDIASALQVSPQAVSKWERGENAPDISLLPALSKLLNVSVDWLLGSFNELRDVFEATVFCSGVPNAREMSQAMSPREFAAWANGVCFSVTEAVVGQGGIPIKASGPGILSFFSGSQHGHRAVQAAITSKRTAGVQLKIGISTGTIYFGPIGHPDYSQGDIMGEAVSIALLIPGWAASHTNSGIAATASTLEGLEGVTAGNASQVQFTGIDKPVVVREIRC